MPSTVFQPISTPHKRSTSHRFLNNKYLRRSTASRRHRLPTSTQGQERHLQPKPKTVHTERLVSWVNKALFLNLLASAELLNMAMPTVNNG